LYVPASQGVHSVPSAPVYPAMHVQIELPSAENVLFGHTVQFSAAEDEYVFTPHVVHVVPYVSHVPTSPACLYLPAPQAIHGASLSGSPVVQAPYQAPSL
jgi:hypothetical protein